MESQTGMFTGLVQHIGIVQALDPTEAGVRLRIDAHGWGHRPELGASIAVAGCCLTVAEESQGCLAFDVIPQTLSLTSLGRLAVGDGVNLEHAVTPSTLMGGHLVQGHIDCLGQVTAVGDDADGWRCRVRVPNSESALLVLHGSVTVSGVSLTVAGLGDDWFEVALIPMTLEHTTLGQIQVGDEINIEFDLIARLVQRQLECSAQGISQSPSL